MAVFYVWPVLLFIMALHLLTYISENRGRQWILQAESVLLRSALELICVLKAIQNLRGMTMDKLIKSFLVLISGIAIIIIFILNHRNISLTTENSRLKAQIEQLKIESQAQAQRFENAYKDAIVEQKQSEVETDKIMLANVPSNCELAIGWGIQQSHAFI